MKNKKSKRHFSSEYTMFSILEYLCINSFNSPISKYHILTKIPSIKQQRQDRISDILKVLEGNGFIESIKTTESTFYKSTDKGNDAYVKWVKNFLSFVRSSYQFKEGDDGYH
ncbi:MAG TPA: hypothetical protein VN703_05960 [Candidatus Sulfopaludibacter sp.]|jgi:DNA-binding PadR family transcriptional regulator|nr:hypothetical protein [Candidatus Sulfopaludibacter sp.]